MDTGTMIKINGRPFVVAERDVRGRYHVHAPGTRRRVQLWQDGGVWRFGRTGTKVEVRT